MSTLYNIYYLRAKTKLYKILTKQNAAFLTMKFKRKILENIF